MKVEGGRPAVALLAALAAGIVLAGVADARPPVRAHAAARVRGYRGLTSQGNVAEVILTGDRVDWFMQVRVSCSNGHSLNESLGTDRSDHLRLVGGRFSEHGRVPTPSGGGSVGFGITGRMHSRSGSGSFFAHYRYPAGVTCSSGHLHWHVTRRG